MTYTLLRNEKPLASGITKRVGLVLLDRIKETALAEKHRVNFIGDNDNYLMTVGRNQYSLRKEVK